MRQQHNNSADRRRETTLLRFAYFAILQYHQRRSHIYDGFTKPGNKWHKALFLIEMFPAAATTGTVPFINKEFQLLLENKTKKFFERVSVQQITRIKRK